MPTTYSLLSSHGCVEELLFFARLIEDYDRVLSHHIQREDIESAIFILKEVPIEKAEPLYYKFAPQMLLMAPTETVDAWTAARFLDRRASCSGACAPTTSTATTRWRRARRTWARCARCDDVRRRTRRSATWSTR